MASHRHSNLRCAPVAVGAAFLLLTAAVATAQDLGPAPAPDPDLKRLPLTSLLDRFAQDLTAGKIAAGGADFVTTAEQRGLRARPDGLVNVEIVGPLGGAPLPESILRRHGGEVDAVWRHQMSAWLPPARARDLARDLPTGYLLRDASHPHENDEGPGVVGSDTYIAGGADGSGIKVGIIDRNFQNFTQAQAVSPPVVPQNPTAYDYTGNGTFAGASTHGTAQVECVYDHAPGALRMSREAYDRRVAGIVSGADGVKTGMLMGQAGTRADGELPVALTGRVYCKVDARYGAIEPGDLLTTSPNPGHAMKVRDQGQAQGAILGKAMTSLESGQGLVLVLVSLQ